jgi:hypothetical protein
MAGSNNQSGDVRARPRRASLVRVLRVPLALALVTVIGLGSALLGDGRWDALSWVALSLPIAVIARQLARARRRSSRSG